MNLTLSFSFTSYKSIYLYLFIIIIILGSFALFAYDKHQAMTGGWRIPEDQLHLSALFGGWLGGILAMHLVRHKTVKSSFRQPYFLCTTGNIVLLLGGSVLYFKNLKSGRSGSGSRISYELNPMMKQLTQQGLKHITSNQFQRQFIKKMIR